MDGDEEGDESQAGYGIARAHARANHRKTTYPLRVGAADLSDVLRFLAELDARKLHYQLTSVRAEALMVEITVPGERWEVEFMEDGSVEVERFRSDGTIVGREALRELGAVRRPVNSWSSARFG